MRSRDPADQKRADR